MAWRRDYYRLFVIGGYRKGAIGAGSALDA
jgi:hypothetical protein